MRRAPLSLRAAALLAAALAGACAQLPESPDSARHAAAIEANRRGDAYFRRGELDRAVQQYREALRLALSIEDVNGIAVNAVNLSIAYQRLGRMDDARASLAPLLEQRRLAFPPASLAQAALRRAILELDERRLAAAADWAGQAAAHCGPQRCALAGAIQNVKARLALEAGQLQTAAASAKAALEASRASGDRIETANALRLLGDTALRAGDAAAALAPLGEALDIDRQLALPRKIRLDLVGLGRASALRGERGAARAYFERALAVSEADRDAHGAAEARALIESLGNP